MIRIIRKYLGEVARKQAERRAAQLDGRAGRAGGFSLLEIMIVIALIGMIGTGVVMVLNKSFQRSKINIAKERIKEISQGVTTYMIDSNNSCPKGLEDLVSQKYVAKTTAKDPWGKDFTLRCPGQNDADGADIVSSGPDRADGTGDDIKSWELQ